MNIRMDKRIEELTPDERELLMDRRPPDEAQLRASVTSLLQRVREGGDAALIDMAREFDGVELSSVEIPLELWEEALGRIDPAVRSALERAARNIRAFHEAQIPDEIEMEVEPGVRLGRRAVPLPAVGVYAPGGRAAYPSSALMGVVPARAAGVEEIIVCSPPGPSGSPSDEVLAACVIGGATRLFALGGAGAIGAMAYGTETVPIVEAIVGPGGQWVTEAKRQVAGRLRIDSPAGPSEVLVVADSTADPARVAIELVTQAEHDPDAAVAAICWEASVLDRVREALRDQVERTPRRAIVEEALAGRGALLLARDRTEALELAEAYAAEHLALYTSDPRSDLETQRSAGTVFLGDSASVAFGDYMTGANHVLPTSGRARSFSGLSALEFLRFYTWQEISPEGAAAMSEDVQRLALAEGLPAHAEAARARGAGKPGQATNGEAAGPEEVRSDGKAPPGKVRTDGTPAPGETKGGPAETDGGRQS